MIINNSALLGQYGERIEPVSKEQKAHAQFLQEIVDIFKPELRRGIEKPQIKKLESGGTETRTKILISNGESKDLFVRQPKMSTDPIRGFFAKTISFDGKNFFRLDQIPDEINEKDSLREVITDIEGMAFRERLHSN